MNITLTVGTAQGLQPLPAVTTWDNFYQAALRAQIITNPIDELDAVNMAQELALADGFKLYKVPATPNHWFRGAGARKPQSLWLSYVCKMGMEVVA